MVWDLQDVYKEVFSKTMTRFEVARVVGARALQLSMGAPPLVDASSLDVIDPVYIAILELLNGLLPMSIVKLRGDKYEPVPVNQLLTPNIRKYLSTVLESWHISSRT